MESGWIKLHRKLLKNKIWKSSYYPQKILAITCLLLASHRSTEFMLDGEEVKLDSGQFWTSIDSLCETTGLTFQQVRTGIKYLKNADFLTSIPTNKGTLISIINWHTYQIDIDESNKVANKQLTSGQQAVNKRLTTFNNVKKLKNVKNKEKEIKEKYTELFEKFWNYYPFDSYNKGPKAKAFSLFLFHEKQGNLDKIRIAVKNLKEAVDNGELEQQFMASSFLAKKPGIKNHWSAWLEKPKSKTDYEKLKYEQEMKKLEAKINGGSNDRA